MTNQFKVGDRVRVRNTDGTWRKPTTIRSFNQTANNRWYVVLRDGHITHLESLEKTNVK